MLHRCALAKIRRRGYPSLAIRNDLIIHNGKDWAASFFIAPDPSFKAVENLTFEHNIFMLGDYGIFGNGVTSGVIALNRYCANWSWNNNLMILRTTDSHYADVRQTFNATSPYLSKNSQYPASSWGVDGIAGVQFVNFDPINLDSNNYRLSPTSPYKNAGTDGRDPGPDWDALDRATAHAKDGRPGSSLSSPASPRNLRIAP